MKILIVALCHSHFPSAFQQKNKKIDDMENDDFQGSELYQELKASLKRAVVNHVTATLITSENVADGTSSRVPADIISIAKDLDAVASNCGLPQGTCVSSAVQKALLEICKSRGAYVLGRFTESSMMKLKDSLEALVAIFGGNADILAPRFDKLRELREVRKFRDCNRAKLLFLL
jgi:hypothetical protein